MAEHLDEILSIRVTELAQSVDRRFDAVDERFDEVDRRFDAVDQRFAEVDRRFDEVDQRFAEVDQRFDAVDQRFAEVDQRFDEVDRRFDEVDRRFDEVDRRFDAVDQRFTVTDARIDALALETREHFAEMQDAFAHNFGLVRAETRQLGERVDRLEGGMNRVERRLDRHEDLLVDVLTAVRSLKRD